MKKKIKKKTAQDSPPQVYCDGCRKVFKSQKSFSNHKTRGCTLDKRFEKCQTLFRCSECNRAYTRKSKLQQHNCKPAKEEKAKCPVCSAELSKRYLGSKREKENHIAKCIEKEKAKRKLHDLDAQLKSMLHTSKHDPQWVYKLHERNVVEIDFRMDSRTWATCQVHRGQIWFNYQVAQFATPCRILSCLIHEHAHIDTGRTEHFNDWKSAVKRYASMGVPNFIITDASLATVPYSMDNKLLSKCLDKEKCEFCKV